MNREQRRLAAKMQKWVKTKRRLEAARQRPVVKEVVRKASRRNEAKRLKFFNCLDGDIIYLYIISSVLVALVGDAFYLLFKFFGIWALIILLAIPIGIIGYMWIGLSWYSHKENKRLNEKATDPIWEENSEIKGSIEWIEKEKENVGNTCICLEPTLTREWSCDGRETFAKCKCGGDYITDMFGKRTIPI